MKSLSSNSKEHVSKDKDKLIKKSQSSSSSSSTNKKPSRESLDNSTSSKQQSSTSSKDKEKNNNNSKEKEKPKKSKKSSKDDLIEVDGVLFDKETIETNKRMFAALKKLECSDSSVFCVSMYDKVKARSSQKGSNLSTGPSSSTNRKSESDYGKANKSGHDTDSDSADSSSDSSSEDEEDIVIKNKKQSISSSKQQRHFSSGKHQQQQSDSSDDEMSFSSKNQNQTSSNKNRSKLNQQSSKQQQLMNRKRKLQSSESSSSSSDDSCSESEKETETTKPKKKQLKKSNAFNWESESDDNQQQANISSKQQHVSVKHKNASPSHSCSTLTKKSKFPNVFEKDKKSSDSKDVDQVTSSSSSNNSKKRPLTQDEKTSTESKHSKEEKIKKKKLPKSSTSGDLLENLKEEKKLSTSKSISNDDDSDDMSSIQMMKKKKKTKDKITSNKTKDQSIKSPKLMSPKSNSNSSFMTKSFNKQQLKEDLELSDSDSDVQVNVTKQQQSKQSKKVDDKSAAAAASKKIKTKSKDDKHDRKSSNSKIEESKSKLLFSSDSDSDVKQPTPSQTKKQKKQTKDRPSVVKSSGSNVKESKSKANKIEMSSSSSDDESIVSEKINTSKKEKSTNEKKIKKEKSSSKKSSKQHTTERHSSISDLSVKQHYSGKESDSDSDSESDNNLSRNNATTTTQTVKNKSPKSATARIFNSIFAACNKDMYSSSESEQSDKNDSSSKMDITSSTNMFLSPKNNQPETDQWFSTMIDPSLKSDDWNDITKSDEAFNNYLKGSSQVKGSGWVVDSDDEEAISSGRNQSMLSSSSNDHLINASKGTLITSSTGKEVLKAIKSPKKPDLLSSSYLSNDSQQQIKQHKKSKQDSKQLKEDKCKENNEERKKKNKKSSKEHHKDSDHHLSLFDSKEIKSEPIIAASAQKIIHHQTPLFGNAIADKLGFPSSLQPSSPFSEKQQLMNTTTTAKQQRLLTDVNNSTSNKGIFESSKTTTTKSPIKDDSNSKTKLSKANEMMFSISSESSNDEFPTIGVSFCSSSSNSSNSNQNVSIPSNLMNNKDKQSSQDKQPVQRKYEEEAAIEAKRLEAELKTKDLSSNWKTSSFNNKDAPKDLFLDLMTNVTSSERLSTSSNTSSNKSTSNLNLSTNKQMHSLHKKPASKSIVLENATTIFNVITSGEVKDPFLDSDETQFKISDGKDELDDQRKIEDDLAVSALLELEMNNENLSEISHLDSSSNNNNNSNSNNQSKPTIASSNKQRKHSSSSELANSINGKDLLSSTTTTATITTTNVIDEEPNRLQIAEDINENSMDSDMFHSANDEMMEEAIAISAITSSTLPSSTPVNKLLHPNKTSPIQKHQLKSPPFLLSSPTNVSSSAPIQGQPTIIEAKPVPNIVDVSTHHHNHLQFNHHHQSDYGADENELTIDLNEKDEEDTKKSIPSFMSTLEKLNTNTNGQKQQRKNSNSSISNPFDLNARDHNQLEIEIPTSLADVKHAVNKNNSSNNISSLLSPKQQGFSGLSYHNMTHTEKDIIRSDASDQSTDALLQSPNSISLSAQNKVESNEESSIDKSGTQNDQRPRRGRRAKTTAKSSESEDSLKVKINTPLSPTNNNKTQTNTTTTRRLTRGLMSNSDVVQQQTHDEFSNENLSEDNNQQSSSLVHTDDDNQSCSLDNNKSRAGKRGRKKKGSNEQQQTIKDNASSSTNNKDVSKNLSPYDVFEFNDSDDESSPALPLMTLHGTIEHHKTTSTQPSSASTTTLLQDLNTTKESAVKNTSASASGSSLNFFEQITPVTPITQTPFSMSTNTSPTQQVAATGQQVVTSQSEQDKEYYTTELSQSHGKLSITIRLTQKEQNQKDQSSGNSSPEHHLETDKLNEDNQNSSNSTDLPSNNNNNKPLTRKSARLMSQVSKTTIDEVIDDVVKGIFNEDSHDYSLSAAENVEYQDLLEEEVDSNPSDNEMNLEKSDEYSFDNNEENTSSTSTKQTNTPVKETTASANSSLNRPFRVTRSSAKNNNDQLITTTTTSTTTSSEPTATTVLESVELKLPNAIVSTSVTSSNTTSFVDSPSSSIVNSSQTALTSTTVTSSSSNNTKVTAKQQHTVMKVEIPKFTKSTETPVSKSNCKSTDEVVKKDENITDSSIVEPLINKLSNSSITTTNNKVIATTITTTNSTLSSNNILKPLDTLSSMPNIIPNVSERIHNSQTPLKLKTGKFNLEDYNQINLSSSQSNTPFVVSSSESSIITNTPSIASSLNVPVSTTIHKPFYADESSATIVTTAKVQEQQSIPTSVVVTSSIIIPSSQSISPSTISTTLSNQPTQLLTNMNISTAPSPFKDINTLEQMRIKDAKTPQLQQQQQQLLSSLSNPFVTNAGQIPTTTDFNNLLQQQLLFQQMHNNPYLAALQHPDLRGIPLPLPLQSGIPYSPYNTALVDDKMKIKSKIDSIVDSTMVQNPMAPPSMSSISGSIRLPSMPTNYPLIRTPHLLSPHDQSANNASIVQQQRFTESPYGRPPLMSSPNLKVDIKPQLIPQRPQSTFSMPTGPINSPSPITGNSSNTPSAQLSPSIGYRKDLQSPMPVVMSQSTIDLSCSNSNESSSNNTAMHPRKLHQRYAKEQQQLLNTPNLIPSPYQMPVGVHPNINLLSAAGYPQFAASMPQLPIQQQPIQMPPQQQPQQVDQSNSGGDSVLIQKYPKLWQGLLELKNDQAAVQMHFVTGNSSIVQNALPPMLADGTNPTPLKIAQRMRLEQTQLDGVCRKMQQMNEHCILLALPCGRDHMDVINQSNKLSTGFIQYLQSKQAAGIINTYSNAPGSNMPAYVVHIFPSCDFSNQNLNRIAPDLLASIAEIGHLLVVIATV